MNRITDEWVAEVEATAQGAADKGLDVIGAGSRAVAGLASEVIKLRKQAVLDRQSREASQTEFARLNLELNEAKDTARKLATMYDETSKALGEECSRVGVLLDEIASTAIAAGMMDPERRGSLDGPNAIQFLRLITEQYEATK